MREHRVNGLAGWAVLVAFVLAPAVASANSTGIIGYSGKRGASFTCNACHSGGVVPSIAFDGPTQMAPGAMATFTFTVTSNSANQKAAGLDLAVSGGALGVVAGQDEQLVAGEITHTKPKSNTNGSASWQFTWQAPAGPGFYDIFGSGNSVNLKVETNRQNGDRSASDVYTVEVVADPSPTSTDTAPEPTATSTPEPPTATATSTDTPQPPTATPTRRDTPVPTATRTSVPSPTPTPTPTAIPTVSGPQPGDGNCDGALGAGDVIAVLARIGAGSAGSCALVDADCNTAIDAADLDVVLGRVFGAPVPASCS